MPMFKLPLSGDVVQQINPWTVLFQPMGGQYGLVNITVGQSSSPRIEAEILSDVAGYGRQLGRIGDAMAVLIRHLPNREALTRSERKALQAMERMLAEVEAVKARHPEPGRGGQSKTGGEAAASSP